MIFIKIFVTLVTGIYLPNSPASHQNAGAVIGKGGKNIKALRTDVSILSWNQRQGCDLFIYFN